MSALPEPAAAALDGVAVCAMRAAGKWVLRGKRERYRQLGNLPLHRAHTVWPLDALNAGRCLVGQLDAVPVVLHRWAPSVDGALVQVHLTRYLTELLLHGQVYDAAAMRAAVEGKL